MSLKCPFTYVVGGAVLLGLPVLFVRVYGKIKRQKAIPSSICESPFKVQVEVALNAALAAGANMQRDISLEQKNDVQTKFNSIDFATETDRANEKMIFDILRREFPGHVFIGEESSAEAVDGIPNLTDSPTWIVDPIDGTTNFVHGFPLSCVSIGLCVNKEPVVGVCFCGSTDELFIAAKGCGAYLNGRPIAVSKASSLRESLVLTEFGYSRQPQDVDRWLCAARTVMLKGAHGLRSLGSGVMDLCYMASGRVDACYAGVAGEGWKPWDYCAGAVILREAGAVLLDITGKNFDMYGKSILTASSQTLADELVETLAECNTLEYTLSETKK